MKKHKRTQPLTARRMNVFTLLLLVLTVTTYAKKVKVKKAEVIKEKRTNPEFTSDDQKEMIRKLKSIIIPKVEFEEAKPVAVINYLKMAGKQYDPDKKGVNFFHMNLEKANGTITIAVSDMSLYDLIKYVCMAGDLNYKIEAHAVVIKPNPRKRK